MPEQPIHFAKPSLAYAKLVATPTNSSWAQAYNAGNLFACLSLSVMEPSEEISLQAKGKELFSSLEAEFFTLEEKSLMSIKEAIELSMKNVPYGIVANLTLAYFKEDILYLFIAGAGKVILKRNGKIGVLLEKKDMDKTAVLAASGYLQNDDTVVLQTSQFAQDIPAETLTSGLELELPNDIAEALSPHIHEKDDGGQAAIIITSHGFSTPPAESDTEEDDFEEDENKEETIHEQPSEEEPVHQVNHKKTFRFHSFSFSRVLIKLKRPTLPSNVKGFKLTHTRKLFLSIAIILILLLIVSIFLTKSNQESSQTKKLFDSIYTPAQKDYDEGKGLQSLNKSLSQEDFQKADALLKQGQGKFKPGSKEQTQIADLQAKTEAELAPSLATVPAKETSLPNTDFLSIEKAQTNGISFAQDDSNFYMLTDSTVTKIDKSSGNKKTVIKNASDWTKGVGVAPYQGNIYLLDQKNGVLKYVASSDGFGKNSYFKQTPDLSKSTAIAIDGSVWILLSDGTILKYTKSESDGFKISSIDKPLSSPTKIFTDLDTNNLYILDKGNRRVVVLNKSGAFQSQYTADVIGQAQDFEVQEKNQKVYVLSGGKIYQIDLQ